VDLEESEPPFVNDQAIKRRLKELRRRIRASLALRALSLLAAGALGLLFVSLAVDRTFRLSLEGRYAASLVYAGALAYCAWRLLIRPWLVALPELVLADLLEKRFPWLEDRLRSAVDFARDPRLKEPAPAAGGEEIGLLMKRRVLKEATEALDRVNVDELVDTPRVVSTLASSVMAMAAVAILFVAWSDTFAIWLRRNVLFQDVEWPYRTLLVAEGFPQDFSLGVPRGDPLSIRILASKAIPDRVRVRIAYKSESFRFNLTREGDNLFVHQHTEVTEPFSFTFEGGDFRSRPHRVFVKERPEVTTFRVRLEFPGYTGKETETRQGDLGELSVPEGTLIHVEAAANKDLDEAWLETEGRKVPLQVALESPRRLQGSYVPKAGGTVTVQLQDREAVPPSSWLRFIVTPVPDRLPTVIARAEGVGSMITPNARIPFKVRASDDYGVTALGVEFQIRGEKPEASSGSTAETELAGGKAPFPALKDVGPLVEEEPVWELGPLHITPEKRLDLRVYAADNDGLHGAKTGYAATQSFLVVTPEKLGEEFLRREEEQRRLLERMTGEERAVRDAAYRLIDEAWKAEGGLKDDAVKEMVSLSKTERQLARQAAGIGSAMRLLLDEMRNNRIGELQETERLANAVIEPLTLLAERLLPGASARIGTIREMGKADERVREGLALAGDLEGIISHMESILSNMKRLEGFTEVVNGLRGIIKIQEESTEAAKKLYRREVESIFEEPQK
jgi:hypothetical protein